MINLYIGTCVHWKTRKNASSFCSWGSFQTHRRQCILGAAIIAKYDMAHIVPCVCVRASFWLYSSLQLQCKCFFVHGQLQNLVWWCPKSHGRPRRCRVPKKVKAGGDSAGYEFAESGPFCSENLQMFTTNPVTTSCVYHCSVIKVLTLTVVHSGTAPTKKFVASAGTFQVSCVHNTVSPWT